MAIDTCSGIVTYNICMHAQQIHKEDDQSHRYAAERCQRDFLFIAYGVEKVTPLGLDTGPNAVMGHKQRVLVAVLMVFVCKCREKSDSSCKET